MSPVKKSALYVGAIYAISFTVVLAGCGSNDASVSSRNTGPADKFNMPNHFGTIAHKCDGPNMVYESENGNSPGKGALAVVANDKRCDGSATRTP